MLPIKNFCQRKIFIILLSVFLSVEPLKCKNNTFDCHGDGKQCISYDSVCDKRNDCGNWEDESNAKDGSPCPGEFECYFSLVFLELVLLANIIVCFHIIFFPLTNNHFKECFKMYSFYLNCRHKNLEEVFFYILVVGWS